jgi:hypothetical protein
MFGIYLNQPGELKAAIPTCGTVMKATAVMPTTNERSTLSWLQYRRQLRGSDPIEQRRSIEFRRVLLDSRFHLGQ